MRLLSLVLTEQELIVVSTFIGTVPRIYIEVKNF